MRIPFLSAMSMLGAIENELRSYLEIAEVATAVAQWRAEATRLGIGKVACDRMESAFVHANLDAALAFAPGGIGFAASRPSDPPI
jgi:hypothetical protein